eukprot:1339023-Amorphochlora_amoeboformis.AAC.1
MVLWGLFALITANRLYLSSPANVILTLFLLTHYLQRTFVFPFLIRVHPAFISVREVFSATVGDSLGEIRD